VIDDAREFFFSEHFMVAIDIVLSTSTDQAVRKQILDISRKARRPSRPPGPRRWPPAAFLTRWHRISSH